MTSCLYAGLCLSSHPRKEFPEETILCDQGIKPSACFVCPSIDYVFGKAQIIPLYRFSDIKMFRKFQLTPILSGACRKGSASAKFTLAFSSFINSYACEHEILYNLMKSKSSAVACVTFQLASAVRERWLPATLWNGTGWQLLKQSLGCASVDLARSLVLSSSFLSSKCYQPLTVNDVAGACCFLSSH